MRNIQDGNMINTTASIHIDRDEQGILEITIKGRLDSIHTGKIWSETVSLVEQKQPAALIIKASDIDYCDGAGIGLLVELKRRQLHAGRKLKIQGLRREFQQLLNVFEPLEFEDFHAAKPVKTDAIEEIGKTTWNVWKDIHTLVAFVGELFIALVLAVKNPRQIRWKVMFLVVETAGVNALPIVALVSFLVGLIVAFQAAIPMRQFGAEIFVADLIALSMLRELGPLMTAIVMAGRTSSAFAAELGSMKVHEEIDALSTMGIEPVRFLVVPKVIAVMIMTPLLTIFANMLGILGGAVVLLSFGYPFITYFNRIVFAVVYTDFLGGIVKSLVFGALIAGIGCLRGLQTEIGASAVGISTTRAVVSGIILIIITDGIFSVVYYYLGI